MSLQVPVSPEMWRARCSHCRTKVEIPLQIPKQKPDSGFGDIIAEMENELNLIDACDVEDVYRAAGEIAAQQARLQGWQSNPIGDRWRCPTHRVTTVTANQAKSAMDKLP